jgi:hypothetical protein
MDQWELHKHCLMNDHAKSTHNEVFVYPAAWKEKQDKSFQTPNNNTDTDTDNDINLYSDQDEEKKPQALFITADMRFFQSPVFREHMEIIIASMDCQTIPHLFQPRNAKEKALFFKAVLGESCIDTISASKRTCDEAGFDSDSTSEAEFV